MTSLTPTPSTNLRSAIERWARRAVPWVFLAASLGVVLTAAVVWQRAGDQGQDSGSDTRTGNPYDLMDWVGPNKDLDSLLAESEVVVVGRFVDVGEVQIVFPAGYNPKDGHLPAGQSPGVPFTNLAFQVDEYLKGASPARLVVTQTGDLRNSNGPDEFPKPRLRETQMLFLTREASRGDNVWASNHGPFGRVRVEGGKLVFATTIRREEAFLSGKSFEQLKDEVKAKSR